MRQPWCQRRRQLCGIRFGQRIHGGGTDAAAGTEVYQPPFLEVLARLADVLFGR